MNTNRFLYKLILVIIALIPIGINAQPHPYSELLKDNTLTVGKSIDIAEANNPQLNQLRQQIAAKDGEWWTSFGLRSPQLIFMQEGIDVNNHSGFDEKRWTVSQSLDFPLKSYFRLRRVSVENQALKFQLKAQQISLKATVKKNYAEVAYALKILELRQEELNIAGELFQAAKVLVEAGETSELDLMKAEIQLAEAKNDLSVAERSLQEARYGLFNLIGLDPRAQSYYIKFPDTLAFKELKIDQSMALARMPLQPVYRMASQNLAATQWGARESWSGFLPDLSFNYYRQNFDNGYDHYGFEIGIKIPLWFPLNQRGSIQTANASRQQALWEQRSVGLNLKKKIENAWHGYQSSLERIRRYHQTIHSQSQRLLQLTLEGYRLGELDILVLLDAQQTYLNSQKRYYDALLDYHRQLIELEQFLDHNQVF